MGYGGGPPMWCAGRFNLQETDDYLGNATMFYDFDDAIARSTARA